MPNLPKPLPSPFSALLLGNQDARKDHKGFAAGDEHPCWVSFIHRGPQLFPRGKCKLT
jgi:hypothetical protein